VLLVFALGAIVLVEATKDIPDFVTTGRDFLVPDGEIIPKPPAPDANDTLKKSLQEDFSPMVPSTSGPADPNLRKIIQSSEPSPINFVKPGILTEGLPTPPSDTFQNQGLTPSITPSQGLSQADLARIGDFTDWSPDDATGKPLSQRRFVFKAYLGKYAGGNWQSTVDIRDGKIAAGSLPNLLFLMSKWSKERIETNERNVEALPLDSPALITERPPFVFLTGTRNFVLTDAEIENLRTYIRLGGAIWGDSSVPGKRSAFDRAFQREMKRVLGESTADFESLPEDHPIFANGYFPKIRQIPAGLNHYKEPVQVMRWNDEIAVVYTSNDYGDMWRIGLDDKGQIDLSRNAKGQFVATDPKLYDHRGVYVRNIDAPAVRESFEFGINMVVHLLTRWESKTALAKKL
jgi:hypothetical protein